MKHKAGSWTIMKASEDQDNFLLKISDCFRKHQFEPGSFTLFWRLSFLGALENFRSITMKAWLYCAFWLAKILESWYSRTPQKLTDKQINLQNSVNGPAFNAKTEMPR